MSASELGMLVMIGVAAVLAPILSDLTGRVAIPGVVFEIGLGIIIGPSVLDLVQPEPLIVSLANMGLAVLMFLAGYEIDMPRIKGRPLRMAGSGWLCSIVLATLVALLLGVTGHPRGDLLIGLALTSTALGTLLPILSDLGALEGTFGRHMLAIGSVGEFGPIVLVAVLLSHTNPGVTLLLFLGFAVLAVGSVVLAGRPRSKRFNRLLSKGLHASSQLPVRISLVVILLMVFLAAHLGLDVLLGSFAAGVVIRQAVAGREEHPDAQVFRTKLEAVGYGFLVPIFFIVSGVRFDAKVFAHHPLDLVRIPVLFLLLVVVRGGPTWLLYRREFPPDPRLSLSLFASTGLPIIVVVATIGVATGDLSTEAATTLVSAGLLSVAILPTIAGRIFTRSRAALPVPAARVGQKDPQFSTDRA